MSSRLLSLLAALAVGSAALTGCGDDAPGTAAPSSAPASAAAPLTFKDAWVKAADKGMSAAFGTLVNSTGADLTVVSATTPASSRVELHEVVGTGGGMKMQPREGGFVVPAHGGLELKPGGYHLMLMGLAEAIEPGDQIAFTLTLKDGSTVAFTALAKSFTGGNETYAPGH